MTETAAEYVAERAVDDPHTGQWAAFVLLDAVPASPTVALFDDRESAEAWCVRLLRDIDPWFFRVMDADASDAEILREYQDVLTLRDFLHVYPVSNPDLVRVNGAAAS